MAPSTITETSLLRETVQNDITTSYNLQNFFVHKQHAKNGKNTKQTNISPYYDQTVSKTDPKFLAPVRRWEKNMGFVTSIRWTSAIPISLFHVVTVTWFLHTILTNNMPMWQTGWFAFLLGQMAGFGVTGGAHRLWSHRSYKAKLPLQIFLLLNYSIAGQMSPTNADTQPLVEDMTEFLYHLPHPRPKKLQKLSLLELKNSSSGSAHRDTLFILRLNVLNNLYNWVRDHRLHHKLTETSADPHDVRRGFFFSHVGWLMMKKHPHVIQEGNKIDMSDIANDPVLRFYNKYFNVFKLLFCAIVPILICVVGWGESWIKAIEAQLFVRYMMSLNFTWSVNSFAHLWGYKPYDRKIMPCENLGVSIIAMGEGWHNYHHTFPWDYKAAELAYFFNVTTYLLDCFAKIGWAYDMKKASPSLVQAVIEKRNGQHSH